MTYLSASRRDGPCGDITFSFRVKNNFNSAVPSLQIMSVCCQCWTTLQMKELRIHFAENGFLIKLDLEQHKCTTWLQLTPNKCAAKDVIYLNVFLSLLFLNTVLFFPYLLLSYHVLFIRPYNLPANAASTNACWEAPFFCLLCHY